MLRDFVSPFDATVARKLVDAGAVIVGTTNTDEFAMGSSTENSCYGPTRNPWDTSRVPGGSSGGSAAAVAAGMVPLALGSDTGGSVRQPAAFCGITGLKPTYGRVSRFGLIAFASSLDQIGPMGRSAADVAMLLQVIAGHDPCDSTSVRQDVPDYVSVLDRDIRGLKVGVRRSQLDEIVEPGISDAIQTALSVLESLGASMVPIDLPHEQYGVAAYYVIAPCEASSNLARYDGVRYTRRVSGDDLSALYTRSRSQYFGPEVQRRIMVGSYALSSGYYNQYYLRASRVRRLIKEDYDRAFARVDVIAGPTTPTTAFAIGQRSHDPLQMYAADVFTVSANLAGIPAISIPAGCANSLPVGMQLQGPAFREPMLLNVAHQFQSVTDWHQRRP
jgi:aspartyl-tRNA(Asn)/glutamyl-tRNA(Gln) amidotransferase subunit A